MAAIRNQEVHYKIRKGFTRNSGSFFKLKTMSKKTLKLIAIIGFFGGGFLLICFAGSSWAAMIALLALLCGDIAFGMVMNQIYTEAEPACEAIVKYKDKDIIFKDPTEEQLDFIKHASQMLSTEKYNTLLGIGDEGHNNIVKGEFSTIMKLQDILFEKEKMYHDSTVRELLKKAYDQGRSDKAESIEQEVYVNNLENIFDDHLKHIN